MATVPETFMMMIWRMISEKPSDVLTKESRQN